MGSDDTAPYWVDEQPAAYRVKDGSDNTVLQCADRTSANHYADLLNKAYRSGYKSGYRAGRRAGG